MRLTWFDANTWLLQWQSLSVLVDPWLVGDLIFGGAPWFFRGSRSRSWPIPESIDLILLSQGLPDHSHIPTLRQLDRQIPVIASPSAARVAEGLGFTQVTQLTHNQQIVFHELEITALPGAPLGPLVQENAYILRSAGQVLYYEPHGYPDSSLANYAPLDVAITPVETLKLPLGATVIQGYATAATIATTTQAKHLVPTAGIGSAAYGGLLAGLIHTEGGIEAVRQQCHNLPTTLHSPTPGVAFDL